jgi:murein L,D-transpeptidase YafK
MAEDIIERLLQSKHITEEEAKILRQNLKNLEDLKNFDFWKAWKHGETYIPDSF